jgi:hypothetical protein
MINKTSVLMAIVLASSVSALVGSVVSCCTTVTVLSILSEDNLFIHTFVLDWLLSCC